MTNLSPEPYMVLRIDHPLTTLLAWQARRAGIQPGTYVRLLLAWQASRCPRDLACPSACPVEPCPARDFAALPGALDAAGTVDRLLHLAARTHGDHPNA